MIINKFRWVIILQLDGIILFITFQQGVHVMPFWQRFLILLLAIVAVGFIVDLLSHYIFGFVLPAYVTGVIGGLTAVPLWELLKRIKSKQI